MSKNWIDIMESLMFGQELGLLPELILEVLSENIGMTASDVARKINDQKPNEGNLYDMHYYTVADVKICLDRMVRRGRIEVRQYNNQFMPRYFKKVTFWSLLRRLFT